MNSREWRNRPYVTIGLAAINILVFLISDRGNGELLEKGMIDVQNVIFAGDYKRLITAMFLHLDVEHIFNNMVSMVFIGAFIEQQLGHLPYGIIYFLSGIGGNIVSLWAKYRTLNPVGSVGASGAIFGLDGLLLAMALFGRREDMPTVQPKRLLVMIALSIYSGYKSGNVDNAAHLGGLLVGLVAGAAYCLLFGRKREQY